MLAGKSLLTLVSKKTGTHFTYKVKKTDYNSKTYWHVRVLTGADNTSNYTYLGFIGEDGKLRSKLGGQITDGAPSFKALEWVTKYWEQEQVLADNVSVLHHSKCCRCGRVLTHPDSIITGMGEECAGKAYKQFKG
jgi:hypothetical protein